MFDSVVLNKIFSQMRDKGGQGDWRLCMPTIKSWTTAKVLN